MYKFFLVILLIFFNCIKVKSQTISDNQIKEVYAYFIENVLPTQLAKGSNVIAVPMTSKEIIASTTWMNTFFYYRLSQYIGSKDSSIINNVIRKTDRFKPPQGYHSSYLKYQDTAISSEYEIQMEEIKQRATYVRFSGFVFSGDGQKCLVFMLPYSSGGITYELAKKNNQWVLEREKTEWLQ